MYFYRLREIADVDVTNLLRAFELPLLYMRATKDRMVYESSMKLIEKTAKNIRVDSFDAPHMLLQTQPVLAARAIEKFVDEVMTNHGA